MDWLTREIRESAELFAKISADESLLEVIRAACRTTVESLQNDGRIFTFGNGGSASQAAHLAEELCGRYRGDRRSLPAVALNACGATLTCIANDYGFDHVFARQLEGLAQKGDVAFALSTSGNSPNILRALEFAKRHDLKTIGFLGKGGGKAAALCDHPIIIPHTNTARIQETHSLLLHLVCEDVEAAFPPKD